MLTVLLIIFACLGGLLIWRGYKGKRRGDEPRCRRCDYDLRGQIEPRCPECGTPFSEATVRRGQRRRRPWRIATGWLFVSLAAVLIAPPVRQYISTTLGLAAWERQLIGRWRWQHVHYLPTSMLIRRLYSPDEFTLAAATRALELRIQAGDVTRKEMARMADPVIAAARHLRETRSDPVFGMETIIRELLDADVLSIEQQQRYFGLWVTPDYLVWGRGRGSLRKLDHPLPDRFSHMFPGLMPHTEVWLLDIDGVPRNHALLISRGGWSAEHFLPRDEAPEYSLTVRISTTWYCLNRPAPPEPCTPAERLGAMMAESQPRMICRLVKDVQYAPPTVDVSPYVQHWRATILAEGEDPATMPAP